jgi:hypothetical protein
MEFCKAHTIYIGMGLLFVACIDGLLKCTAHAEVESVGRQLESWI